MKPHNALLIAFLLLAGCLRQPPPQLSSDELPPSFHPDYGKSVQENGRPSEGTSDQMPLGDTRFRAYVCAGHYTDTNDVDPDFYTISVQRMHGVGSVVYFSREFPVSDIPASVLTAKASDIVSFDSARRVVTFAVGATHYTYTLPSTP